MRLIDTYNDAPGHLVAKRELKFINVVSGSTVYHFLDTFTISYYRFSSRFSICSIFMMITLVCVSVGILCTMYLSHLKHLLHFSLSLIPFRRQSCSGQITYGGKRSSNP